MPKIVIYISMFIEHLGKCWDAGTGKAYSIGQSWDAAKPICGRFTCADDLSLIANGYDFDKIHHVNGYY